MINFNELTNRQQLILAILITETHSLTSFDIANKISVSSRTIKNEMPMIKSFLKSNGAKLIAKRNLGYMVEIVDKKQFNTMKETLRSKNAHLNVKSLAKSELDIFIKRKLISEEDFITIENLSQEFYLSKTTIFNMLKKTYPFFKSFNLDIVKNSQGIKIIGPEYARRMAMTELVEITNDSDNQMYLNCSNFEKWTNCSMDERQDIRHLFLKLLRKSQFSVRDSISHRISMYLVIARNRFAFGKTIDELPNNYNDIKDTKIYQLSKIIFSELAEKFDGFGYAENEITFLAIYISSNLDISTYKDIKEFNKYINDVDSVCNEISSYTNDYLGFNIIEQTKSESLFRKILLPMIISKHFSIDGATHYDFSYDNVYLSSPLMHYFAVLTCNYLNNRFNIKTSVLDEYLLTCFFWTAYLNVSFPIKPLNILTTHSLAAHFANEQCVKIKKMFPELINSITPVEMYEIRELPEEYYDAVIAENVIPQEKNQGLFGYNYDFPACQIKMSEEGHDIKNIYNNILFLAYQVDRFIPEFDFNFYNDFIYVSKIQIFQLFAERYASNKSTVNAFYNHLKINNQSTYNSNGNMICIFGNSKYCEVPKFDCYTLNKSIKWNGFNVKYIFYVCLAESFNALNVKITHILLKYLSCNPELIEDFKKNHQETIHVILQDYLSI